MAGPEANLWAAARKSLPPKTFATRIENKHGGGVPDVHVVWDGKPFWIELKICKHNAVGVRPEQVAWNMAYWARGGRTYYLVKHSGTKVLHLFEGSQGPALALSGLSGAEGHEFRTFPALWEHIGASF
jgi:hypothetical protein